MSLLNRRPQLLLVLGMLCIALGTASLNRLHRDFLSGLVFGAGIALLLLGVIGLRRH